MCGGTDASVLFFCVFCVRVAAGYLFGVPEGTACVSVASTLAAGASFLISRYGLRDYISKLARQYPKFLSIDRAIGREGLKFVFLLRLSPLLPFALSNYLVRRPVYSDAVPSIAAARPGLLLQTRG